MRRIPAPSIQTRRRSFVAVATAIGALVLAGCGSTASTAPKSAPSAKAFPESIAAANGTVRLARAPKRIVSLSPSATDMLFAIGAGHQVVAVDADSTYPKSAPTTKLSGLTPNVEALAKYKPDLVVISYAPSGFLPELAKLKIAVLEEPAATTLADSYAQIATLGRATGHVAGAVTVATSMRSKIASLVASAPKPTQPRTYYYELDQTYYTATSATFIGSILSKFGLRNIADKKGASSGYPQLTAEYIVQSDPQLIFLADTVCCGQSPATVAKRPGWSAIAAVHDHDVVGLNDSVASQWGPRVVTLVSDIATALRSMDKHAA